MAKTRKQKEEAVGELESALKGGSAVFVGFTGINVTQETAMRRAMKGEGLGYLVAKKTLLRRALKSVGHDAELEAPGEVALAYSVSSDDATAAPRRVHAFGKEFGADKVSILGGLFEGRMVDAAMMKELATIPSMQTLQAMFAQLINSPRQRFAVVLSKIAETKTA